MEHDVTEIRSTALKLIAQEFNEEDKVDAAMQVRKRITVRIYLYILITIWTVVFIGS